MLADLDLLLTAVFVTADDLLPWRRRNARRSVTDAEVVTLAVAQAMMDIPSDREFLAVAARRLEHLIPKLPKQPGYWKRRARLADTIEWLCAMFAQDSPGYVDDIVLIDSTPVECGRSVETARRSDLGPACAHHYSRSHSRWFWGMRLHLLAAPDGTPRGDPRLRRPKRTRRRAAAVRDRAARRRADRLRQGLRRPRLRGPRRRTLRRNDPAPSPPRRARPRTRAVLDPPAHRIDLLDPQRPSRTRTPPRPQPPRAQSTNRGQTARTGRRRLAQPLHRPTHPRLRCPRRLTTRGINHLGLRRSR
jgi:hypothetical protein